MNSDSEPDQSQIPQNDPQNEQDLNNEPESQIVPQNQESVPEQIPDIEQQEQEQEQEQINVNQLTEEPESDPDLMTDPPPPDIPRRPTIKLTDTNDHDDDLDDFDVEAQIKMELDALPPDIEDPDATETLNEQNLELDVDAAPLQPPPPPRDSDAQNEIDFPTIALQKPNNNTLSLPDLNGGGGGGGSGSGEDDLLKLESRQMSLISDYASSAVSLQPVKSWSDLIADMQNQEDKLESQRQQIEDEVDAALGFINMVPHDDEENHHHTKFAEMKLPDTEEIMAVESGGDIVTVGSKENVNSIENAAAQEMETSKEQLDDEEEIESPIVEGLPDTGFENVAPVVSEDAISSPRKSISSSRRETIKHITLMPYEDEMSEDDLAPVEAEVASKELLEEKAKFEDSINSLDSSLSSELDILAQLRKDMATFKSMNGSPEDNTSPKRNLNTPSIGSRLRHSFGSLPAKEAPWASQSNEELDSKTSPAGETAVTQKRGSIIAIPDFSLARRKSASSERISAEETDVFVEKQNSLSRRKSMSAAAGVDTFAPEWSPTSKKAVEDDERFDDIDSRRSSIYSDCGGNYSRRVSVTPDGVVDEELRAYKRQERKLKIDYQHLVNQTKEEVKKHQELTMLIENFRSHLGLQHRAVRNTKMKVRENEQRYRQLLHWLQVVGKVAYEREKDKANALLQRATKIFEKFKRVQDKVTTKANTNSHNLKKLMAQMNVLVTDGKKFETQEEILSAEVAELNRQLEEETKAFEIRKTGMEQALSRKLQSEEQSRLLEAKVLAAACQKQSKDGKPIELEELEYLEAVDVGLSKIPYLKDASHLLYANFDNNQISSLRGLDYISTLNTVSFNRNRLMSIDLGLLGNIKFFSANNNSISQIDVSEKAKGITWLDLSCNPIRDFISTQSEELNVLDLHNTEIRDFKCAENLVNLIYLNLARTKIPNGPIHYLHESKILQYLSLARNKYSDVPDLDNPILHILDMDHNFLKRLCLSGWFPRLRILHLAGNKIDYIESLSTCPFLVELYLADNKIEDPRNLLPIAACQQLEVLDLSRNPVTTWADFDMFCICAFDKLKYLNEVFISVAMKNYTHFPLIAYKTLKGIRKYYSQNTLLSKTEIHQKIEQYEDYVRLTSFYQQAIDEFMGLEFDPYLSYLQGPKDATQEMKNTMQAGRLAWLVATLTAHSTEIQRVNTFASPDVDIANSAMIDVLTNRMIACACILAQACYRRRCQRRKYKRMRRAAIKIQKWWRRTFEEKKKQRRWRNNMGGIIKIQALWRGRKVRKEVAKRKQEDAEMKKVLEAEENALLDWAAKNHEEEIDDSYKNFLLKQTTKKMETQRVKRTVAARDHEKVAAEKGQAAATKKGTEAAAPRIEDEVLVLFSEQQEEQGWITTEVMYYTEGQKLHREHGQEGSIGRGSRPQSAGSNDDASSIPLYRASKIKPIVNLSLAQKQKPRNLNVIYEWDIGGPSRIHIPKTPPTPILPKLMKRPEEPKVDFENMPFATSNGVQLLVNNYVANKVTGSIPSVLQASASKYTPLPSIRK
ncbi:hypothetical protein HDU99_003325 [Rhizoclosmatium hyalinum]|nr:hypothetical protein HDU99_003325 [Rhizoclosmatium hyalinum]